MEGVIEGDVDQPQEMGDDSVEVYHVFFLLNAGVCNSI